MEDKKITKTFKCPECENTYDIYKSLYNHVRYKHKKAIKRTEPAVSELEVAPPKDVEVIEKQENKEPIPEPLPELSSTEEDQGEALLSDEDFEIEEPKIKEPIVLNSKQEAIARNYDSIIDKDNIKKEFEQAQQENEPVKKIKVKSKEEPEEESEENSNDADDEEDEEEEDEESNEDIQDVEHMEGMDENIFIDTTNKRQLVNKILEMKKKKGHYDTNMTEKNLMQMEMNDVLQIYREFKPKYDEFMRKLAPYQDEVVVPLVGQTAMGVSQLVSGISKTLHHKFKSFPDLSPAHEIIVAQKEQILEKIRAMNNLGMLDSVKSHIRPDHELMAILCMPYIACLNQHLTDKTVEVAKRIEQKVNEKIEVIDKKVEEKKKDFLEQPPIMVAKPENGFY